ncbi:MAG TPA: hypothetical protein PLE32_07600 [Haliscomenobacter sp.]|nr:hypothetical protein [Haliscomenobacter sp.]
MIRALTCIGFFAALCCSTATGQNRVAVKSGHTFQDGIYLSLEDLQSDKPHFLMSTVELSAVVNENKHTVEVDWIRLKKGDTLRMDSIWGLCWRGRPYIRVSSDSTKRKLAIFTAFQTVGNICLFSYETEEERMVEIKAYFPDTGIPFRKGKIKNVDTVVRERMLRLATGEIVPLTQENLAIWVQDYPGAQQAVEELSPEKAQKTMPRIIVAYNEQNPFFLK